jgi:iron complex outermembrane receptor protein
VRAPLRHFAAFSRASGTTRLTVLSIVGVRVGNGPPLLLATLLVCAVVPDVPARPGPEVAGSDDAAGRVKTHLPVISVSANNEGNPPPTQGVSVVIERAAIDAGNTVTAADALRYAPNLTVRMRYIGDRNGIVGARTAGTLQSARSLVYADGLLLSDFLGSGFDHPPRWGLVDTQAIESVEVLYGPFSALYPGNSLGTTVIFHTRLPQAFEAGAGMQAFAQDFSDAYGPSQRFDGQAFDAHLGNRSGAWSWRLALERLDSRSQPMQYAIARPGGDAATAVAVTGAIADRNPDGSPRLVVGRTDLDDSRQSQVRIGIGFDHGDVLGARLTLAQWRNDDSVGAQDLLHDAAGAGVYAGPIDVAGTTYTIAPTVFSPSASDEEHLLLGLELDGALATDWHWNASASRYDYRTSHTREAALPPPEALAGGAGTLADSDGTGWQTLDLRADGPLGAAQTLSAGFHVDRYVLDTRVSALANWRGSESGPLQSAFSGRSLTRAAYLEDQWDFASQWTATIGLRAEHWRAWHGLRANADTTVGYPSRGESALSPKAALAWAFADDWQLRLSRGRATRFPTVGELFQGSISANAIVNGNPDLDPERDDATDLTLDHASGGGHWRVSLFRDRLRDSLYTQTDITRTPSVTNVQNIARVRMQGIEAEFVRRNVGIDGLDVQASVAFNRSETLVDQQFPAAGGKDFPRIPRVRAALLLDWRLAAGWDVSMGVRHSGRQYGTLDNSDVVDTFGAVSRFTVVDAKLHFHPARDWTASIGVDNLGNQRYWVFHPWPGRTWYGQLAWHYD